MSAMQEKNLVPAASCPKDVIRRRGIAGAQETLGMSRKRLRLIKCENGIPALRPGPKPTDPAEFLATLSPDAPAILRGASLAGACERLSISRAMARRLLAHLAVRTGIGVRPRKGIDLILVEQKWTMDELKSFVSSSSNSAGVAKLGISVERMREVRVELGLPPAKNGRPFRQDK